MCAFVLLIDSFVDTYFEIYLKQTRKKWNAEVQAVAAAATAVATTTIKQHKDQLHTEKKPKPKRANVM